MADETDAETAEGDEGCCTALTGVYCYAKVLVLQST